MGDLPIQAITPARIQAIKEALHEHPSKANQVLGMLSILFKLAVRTGKLQHNPATNPGKLLVPPRWSEAAEKHFTAELRPALKLLFGLMLYTLQRLSDCLAMTITQVIEKEGRLYIVLTRLKTETLMAIQVHNTFLEPLLRARLNERVTRTAVAPDGTTREVISLFLVPSPNGHAWLRRNASRAWDHDIALANKKRRDELIAAGASDEDISAELVMDQKQRRDLRRTGIVRLAERGATTPQIAAISGHEIVSAVATPHCFLSPSHDFLTSC
jgi:integrase